MDLGNLLDSEIPKNRLNKKLLEMDNVVLLPHMGSATIEGRINMGEKVLINIRTFVDGHKPPDRNIDESLLPA